MHSFYAKQANNTFGLWASIWPVWEAGQNILIIPLVLSLKPTTKVDPSEDHWWDSAASNYLILRRYYYFFFPLHPETCKSFQQRESAVRSSLYSRPSQLKKKNKRPFEWELNLCCIDEIRKSSTSLKHLRIKPPHFWPSYFSIREAAPARAACSTSARWWMALESLSGSADKEKLDYTPGSECWIHTLTLGGKNLQRPRPNTFWTTSSTSTLQTFCIAAKAPVRIFVVGVFFCNELQKKYIYNFIYLCIHIYTYTYVYPEYVYYYIDR